MYTWLQHVYIHAVINTGGLIELNGIYSHKPWYQNIVIKWLNLSNFEYWTWIWQGLVLFVIYMRVNFFSLISFAVLQLPCIHWSNSHIEWIWICDVISINQNTLFCGYFSKIISITSHFKQSNNLYLFIGVPAVLLSARINSDSFIKTSWHKFCSSGGVINIHNWKDKTFFISSCINWKKIASLETTFWKSFTCPQWYCDSI